MWGGVVSGSVVVLGGGEVEEDVYDDAVLGWGPTGVLGCLPGCGFDLGAPGFEAVAAGFYEGDGGFAGGFVGAGEGFF